MAQPKNMTLLELPPEILSQIISHAATAQSLHNIGLTCHVLHELVETNGWSEFVRGRFPSFQVPPIWKQAAHALTTLSRNWDRKAIIARNFEPFNTTVLVLPDRRTDVVKGRWKRPQGQTMGYQPVIDSYEEWTGSEWGTRREVVAWGAGAKLMVKIVNHGQQAELNGNSSSTREHERARWLSYHDTRHTEGRDDITTLSLLQSHQLLTAASSTQRAIVGRASGELTLLNLTEQAASFVEQRFETEDSLVRSVDVRSDESPLMAACLGDARAVLYHTTGDKKLVQPASEVKCVGKTEPRCRTWSARFLSDRQLAIGRGPSTRIVQVYDIGPAGLSQEPVRVFGTGRGGDKALQTSVYPLCGIPESTVAPRITGNVFLSGGYDGYVRVHDMRSPSDCEAFISDPTDFAPVFSLLTVGRERIVAGGAINALLKIYDMRMPGGRVYSYFDVTEPALKTLPNRNSTRQANQAAGRNRPKYEWSGSNIFTTPHETTSKWSWRGEGGPVYSLSRPSSSSTSLYVGREGSVMQFNMTAMLDKHPDPFFAESIMKGPSGEIDAPRTWDSVPQDRVLRLSMYEQTEHGGIPLRVQSPVASLRMNGSKSADGYDERWLKTSEGHRDTAGS